jgi:hypothetical protein
MTREQKLELLANDYATNYAGDNFPNEFKSQGSLTQCNFGGLLVILANSGDGLLCWSDWSDDAIDTELTECEIEYLPGEDANEDDELEPKFNFKGTYYSLNDVMRIN